MSSLSVSACLPVRFIAIRVVVVVCAPQNQLDPLPMNAPQRMATTTRRGCPSAARAKMVYLDVAGRRMFITVAASSQDMQIFKFPPRLY